VPGGRPAAGGRCRRQPTQGDACPLTSHVLPSGGARPTDAAGRGDDQRRAAAARLLKAGPEMRAARRRSAFQVPNGSVAGEVLTSRPMVRRLQLKCLVGCPVGGHVSHGGGRVRPLRC